MGSLQIIIYKNSKYEDGNLIAVQECAAAIASADGRETFIYDSWSERIYSLVSGKCV